MKTKISNYLRAGNAGLYILSPEEQRVEADFKAIAEDLKYGLFFWSVVDGLVNSANGSITQAQEPLEVLQAIDELPEKSIVLLRDFHLFLEEANPVLLRKLKDALHLGKSKSKHLVIIGCRLCLPPELEREIVVVELALPPKQHIASALQGILESAALPPMSPDAHEAVLNAATGLTTIEAENAFALSVVETRTIVPEIVAREKAKALKKNGILEIIETHDSLISVGGLEVLKAWLIKRKDAFSRRALDYGLPAPKGLLILGVAGTGKSLTAKATANVFGVPLLKLDAGRLFGSLVGQSESNLRAVIQTAEAIAPCVLWIDEIEKGFSGSRSSGATDGGTSARVFGSFLSWMQEKKAPVFVTATANDVSQLPPEMLRKGRWDELFFVDLPNQTEREAIWSIQIEKYGRKANDFDLVQLARATEGLTGSEIECLFVESLFAGFEQDAEPNDLTIVEALNEFVPLSKLMAEQMSALRSWAKGRARLATSMASPGRKLRAITVAAN